MNFFWWKFVLLATLLSLANCCDKRPENAGRRKKGDNGYRLVIGGDPDGYKPGSYYNCMIVTSEIFPVYLIDLIKYFSVSTRISRLHSITTIYTFRYYGGSFNER
jgi:hypothetical protein